MEKSEEGELMMELATPEHSTNDEEEEEEEEQKETEEEEEEEVGNFSVFFWEGSHSLSHTHTHRVNRTHQKILLLHLPLLHLIQNRLLSSSSFTTS